MRKSDAPRIASRRLLVRSERLPAIGRHTSELSESAPAMKPMIAPFAPSDCEKPAMIGVPIMLLVM